MLNLTKQAIIQKYIILGTGIPGSDATRASITRLYDQTDDLEQVDVLVNAFMNHKLNENAKGIKGVVQEIYSNGFSLNLTDLEAEQLVNDYLEEGIDSWSELFAFLTTQIEGYLGLLLDNRAEAANLFADLLVNLGKDGKYLENFYDPIVISTMRSWLTGINETSKSLDIANATALGLAQRFDVFLGDDDKDDDDKDDDDKDDDDKDGDDKGGDDEGDDNEGDGNDRRDNNNERRRKEDKRRDNDRRDDEDVEDVSPTLSSSNPVDNAIGLQVASDIELIFDKVVVAGSGDIVIHNRDSVADTRIIAVNDISQITFDGRNVIINPTVDLNPGSEYNLQLADSVIVDLVGNAYAGINDAVTLNFTTAF